MRLGRLAHDRGVPVSRAAVILLVAAACAAANARADEEPAAGPPAAGQRFSGEALAALGLGSAGRLALRGWSLRLAAGARGPPPPGFLSGLTEIGWLVTAGFSRWQTPAGLQGTGFRLGMGIRAGFGRFFAGADVEGVRLDVGRVSTSGQLRGTGLGVRLLGGFDLLRFGDAALAATVEGTLDTFDPFGSPENLPAIQVGAGLRW